MIYDMIGLRGGVTHWEWMGRVDGMDYPLQGVEEVITNAYRRVDDRNYVLTAKVDGQMASMTTIQISDDGLTMTAKSNASTAVYRRR